MNIYSLFPTAVGRFEYKDQLSDELDFFIKNTKKVNNNFNKISKNTYILKEPVFNNLLGFFQTCLNEYFKNIWQPNSDIKINITQSWLNYTNKGESHHPHNHPNSFISGVFYTQVSNDDKIYFLNNKDTSFFDIVSEKSNDFSNTTVWVPAEKNVLLLFPSTLYHEVRQFQTDHERISISFNTFPKGRIGQDDRLTELYL